MTLLERIARFLFDNTGRVTSAKSIADYLKSQRLRVGVETVQNYLSYFEEALVAHRTRRFDIKGRRLLEIYVQVAYLLATPETIEREFGVLKAIPDNYPKLVLSMDPVFVDDIDGIRRRHIVDFLTDSGNER